MRMGPRGYHYPNKFGTTDAEFRGNCLIIRGTRRLYKLESGAEQDKRREDLEPQPTTTEGEEKNPVSTPCVCILTLRLNVHCKLEVSTMATLYSEYSCEYLC